MKKSNVLKGILAGALLTLRLASNAHAAEISLEEALDTIGSLTFTATNSVNWTGQTNVTHDGVDAAESPVLGANGALPFETTVTGPGIISFWWKVNAGSDDRLRFYVSDVEQANIPGNRDWESRRFSVPQGEHVLRWALTRGGDGPAGQNRAWVDEVQYIQTTNNCVFTISTPQVAFSWNSNAYPIYVTTQAGCSWDVVNTNPWITCVINTNASSVTCFIAENNSRTSRTGVVLIASQPCTFYQSIPPCPFTLSPSNATYSAAGGTGFVSVATTPDCTWSPATTNAWITLLTGFTTGDATLAYAVATNTGAARVGSVRVAGQFHVITQSAAPTGGCTYALSPSSANFSSSSSTGFVSVTAPAGCSWVTINTNPWITVAVGTNGSGNGTVRYNVAANTNTSPRNGNMFIAGQPFPVTQSGFSNATVTLSQALDTEATSLIWSTFGSALWTGQFAVSHDGLDAAVSGTAPDSGNSYLQTMVNGPGTLSFWWKVSSQSDSDTLSFFISGNEQARISGDVDWTQRTFIVPAGSQTLQWRYLKDGSASAGEDRGWVDQVQYTPDSATNCFVTIAPTNRVHDAGTSSARVDVDLPEGCFWGLVNTNPWITTVLGLGYPGFVDYTVAANPSTSPRTGIMLVGGNIYTVTQLGATNVTCTYAVSPTNRTHGFGATSNYITINTAAGCPWSVINTNPWILLPAANGSGSVILSYLIQGNSSTSPRSGYLSVANTLIFMTQNGAPGGTNTNSCTITLSPASRSHDSSSATGTVTVATGPGCNWNVIETNNWLSILSVANGTVTYVITANSNATARTGNINIGGQIFIVSQFGDVPLSATPVVIPNIEVTNIGHRFYSLNPLGTNAPPSGSFVQDFLIDQGHTSGGGAELPNVSVNWDTNAQFTMTVAAPAGMKFVVEAPAGRSVGFAGFLWWESTRGGFSPAGTASVHFENLEGEAPEFSGTTPVLSDSHGFFGFADLEGTTVSNRFAFTSVTLTATLAPKFTGNGAENYVPHHESAMLLSYSSTETNDPGNFVSIVPAGPLPLIQAIGVSSTNGVDLTIYGVPGRTHVVECSTDTVTWTQIASGVMPQSGAMKVRDVSRKSTATSRFYRIVELP